MNEFERLAQTDVWKKRLQNDFYDLMIDMAEQGIEALTAYGERLLKLAEESEMTNAKKDLINRAARGVEALELYITVLREEQKELWW